jgi:hypothetical protein
MGTGDSSAGKAAGGLKLTTNIHLVSRLRMSGVILVFHPYAPIKYTRKYNFNLRP